LEEALILRHQGITQRILLLGTLLDASELQLCSQLQIDVTAHDQPSLALIAIQARHAPLRVWLKLDSGMHRVGLGPQAFVEAARAMAEHPGVLEVVHMSHFSSADDPASTATQRQLSCFQHSHAVNPRAPISLANSAALISRPDTHGDWVRPGIMLYGINPLQSSEDLPLRSVMTLRSRIIAIREIEAGERVGYNERWTSVRQSRIGTVGIGYGDGYPRHARSGTPVWINV
jgi:alanine racemase